jgi:peptidoglycan/LPS O-acetylase OafA/YrhL
MAINPNQRGHIPALDGVRGLAILLVLVFHARSIFELSQLPFLLYRVLDLSWCGVDLFLLLSGFLITGILLDSRESAGYFRTFYFRRALRIFPLYFAYLFLILVIARQAILHTGGVDWWSSTNVASYLIYLSNWTHTHGIDDPYLSHLWSLAIEEQFYFVWPLIVWFCPPKRLGWICGTIAVLALGCRVYLGVRGENIEVMYRLTVCRMDALALGALVAVGSRHFRPQLDRWVPPILAATVLGLVNVLLWMRSSYWNDSLLRTVGVSLLDVIFACLVHRLARLETGAWTAMFSSGILRSCGKYSYAMYLLHAVTFGPTAVWAHTLPLTGKYLYIPVFTGITYGLAWISWRVLEQPFLRLKRHFPYGATAQQEAADVALAAMP